MVQVKSELRHTRTRIWRCVKRVMSVVHSVNNYVPKEYWLYTVNCLKLMGKGVTITY
jgi:hypothetical protein